MTFENPRDASRLEVPERLAIISDIHGNLSALQATFEAIAQDGAQAIYCCGDIVGYGPFPNECCDLIRERGIPTIAGNHDHAALGLTSLASFNEIAREAAYWTMNQLTEENRRFLLQLPMTLETPDFLLVHSSPDDPPAWNYVLTLGDARMSFEKFRQVICFIGHSHQPFIISLEKGVLTHHKTMSVQIEPGRRFLVNVGSVGQPRDQNNRCSYALYDRAKKTIELKRCLYDIQATQAAIAEKKLPLELGDRLIYGW
ncbi:MAG: metallophosphoesterase family protein [Candidatus Sumerlaeota bacterium]|nr:metallophosphoesterase family protein [Candidatus Sumerlaeota bacterium]